MRNINSIITSWFISSKLTGYGILSSRSFIDPQCCYLAVCLSRVLLSVSSSLPLCSFICLSVHASMTSVRSLTPVILSHCYRRIDFRELVSDLFSLYKTRIWMQQVELILIYICHLSATSPSLLHIIALNLTMTFLHLVRSTLPPYPAKKWVYGSLMPLASCRQATL